MADPKLTVLTTVFNGERYLDEAIESILGQDFTDFEYLIVDDGSSDSTPHILKRWSERDSRIVIERIAKNGGIAGALNRGLALARGQYIGRQDADDICVGSRLRCQVDLLDKGADVVLVSANFTMIDADGRWVDNCVVENPPAVIEYLLNFTNAAMGAGGGGMFRRDIARQLGGFREDLEVSVDYEFFTRLVQRGRIVILPFVGSKYRLHDQQSSIRRRDVQRRNGLMISRQMLSRFLGRCLSDEEFCAVASIWMRLGQRDMAAAGHRMLRETYARFASTQVNHRHLRRVRRITATQWFFSAITFVKLRALREAAHNVYYAMLWDPAILGIGALHLIDRTWVRLRRAAIGTTVGSHF